MLSPQSFYFKYPNSRISGVLCHEPQFILFSSPLFGHSSGPTTTDKLRMSILGFFFHFHVCVCVVVNIVIQIRSYVIISQRPNGAIYAPYLVLRFISENNVK